MRATAFILSYFFAAALAAPAVVWNNASREKVVHSSSKLDTRELLSGLLGDCRPAGSSLEAVVFILSKGAGGEESFSTLASSGSIPGIAEKSESAETFYHHVAGIESVPIFSKAVTDANKRLRVVQATLEDFQEKMSTIGQPAPKVELEVTELGVVSKAVKLSRKRARSLASANVLVVNVDPSTVDAAEIDSAVVSAIESKHVQKVLLTGVRSTHEIKQERYALSKQRMDAMQAEGEKVLQARRRRLEQDQDQNANNNGNNQNNDDLAGTYYVSMTPNILSGILFTMLFAVVTWIGVSCLGAIAGQDVYVSKMPSVGREA